MWERPWLGVPRAASHGSPTGGVANYLVVVGDDETELRRLPREVKGEQLLEDLGVRQVGRPAVALATAASNVAWARVPIRNAHSSWNRECSTPKA